jgi:hypothetical protein
MLQILKLFYSAMFPKLLTTKTFGVSNTEESGKQMGKEQPKHKNSHKMKKDHF